MTDEERRQEKLSRLRMWYGMDGEPLSSNEWAEMLTSPDKRIIQQDHVGPYFVSTVLLGVDYGFGDSQYPLTFETMIFRQGESAGIGDEVFCMRYTNKHAAQAGHEQALERARREEFDY